MSVREMTDLTPEEVQALNKQPNYSEVLNLIDSSDEDSFAGAHHLKVMQYYNRSIAIKSLKQ